MNMLQEYDGRYLRSGEIIYRVVGRIKGRPAVRLDLDGTVSEITLEEFHHQISLGNVSEGQEPVFNDRLMTAEEASEAEFRKFILERAERYQELGYKWCEIREELKAEVEREPRFASRAGKLPSVRTIQNYRKQHAEKGSLALMDKRSMSGNRTVRYDDLFREIVLEVLEESYLGTDRMTEAALARTVRAKYLREFKRQFPDAEPGPYRLKSVRSVMDRYIPHADVLKSRLGKSARQRQLQAARFQIVEHAYERIEIDSTQADIWVIYDGNLVRVWITMAIDAATGFIVGLLVSLNSPTAMATATVLYEAMTGNDDEFFDRHGIQNRVRVAGYPMTVVADQGSENSGEVIDLLLSSTAIELQKNIPGHPEKKPFVERAFGTMKDFVTQLDGATKTRELSSKERHDRAKAEACWTFEEFEKKLQVWRYDVYGCLIRRKVQSPLKRPETPTESWHRLRNEAYVPEPPSKQKLAQIFYCQVERRTVHNYGIEVGYVQYSSWELREIKRNTKGTLEVEVRVNPADIREVAVIHPKTGEIIYVPAKDPDLPAISTTERDRIIALNRRDADECLSAREILAALVAGKHHKPSKAVSKGLKERHAAQRGRRDAEIASNRSKARADVAVEASTEPSIPVIAPETRNRIKAWG